MLVHGRLGDDAKLQHLVQNAKNSCLLFPDDDAITVADFQATTDTTTTSTTTLALETTYNTTIDLLIIVVDATWRRARKMAKYLERNVIGDVKHIKLETDTVSVYSRTQTEPGRICTIEAVSLLLQEMGEQDGVCRALIDYVKINNQALRPKKKSHLYETGRGKFHPAWYFHMELVPEKRERPTADDAGADVDQVKKRPKTLKGK